MLWRHDAMRFSNRLTFNPFKSLFILVRVVFWGGGHFGGRGDDGKSSLLHFLLIENGLFRVENGIVDNQGWTCNQALTWKTPCPSTAGKEQGLGWEHNGKLITPKLRVATHRARDRNLDCQFLNSSNHRDTEPSQSRPWRRSCTAQ